MSGFQGFSEVIDQARRMVKESDPIVTASDGTEYSREELKRVRPPIDKATALEVSTLSALCDLIIEDSTIDQGKPLVVHVTSPGHVDVYTLMDERRNREFLIKAEMPKRQDITGWKSLFDFNLAILINCVDDDERKKLLEFTGNVVASDVMTVADDGISQTANVNRQITGNKVRDTAPSLVYLKPFRSFSDVAQVASPFVLRMRNSKDEQIEIGVFECDGGVWKIESMEIVAQFIEGRIKAEHLVIR